MFQQDNDFMRSRKRTLANSQSNGKQPKCLIDKSEKSAFELDFLNKSFDLDDPKMKKSRLDNSFFDEFNTIWTRSKSDKPLNPFDLSSDVDEISTNELPFVCSTPKPNASKRYSSLNESGSLDSGFETESIFSFASKSCGANDEDNCDIDSCINLSIDISSNSNSNFAEPLVINHDRSKGHLLPCVNDSTMENVLIPEISGTTLVQLLSGNYTNMNNKIQLIDCRFPYEYQGGHIMSSKNIHTCQKLLHKLFPNVTCNEGEDDVEDKSRKLEEDIDEMTIRSKLKRDDTIYIFYCEFSSYRGPKLAQCLRGLDRLANDRCRKLYFPNLFVLNNGYSQFFIDYPNFCAPLGYVSMKQTSYSLRSCVPGPETSYINYESGPTKCYRKEQVSCEREMRESDKTLQHLISQRTKDRDILKLFSSHPVIGAGHLSE